MFLPATCLLDFPLIYNWKLHVCARIITSREWWVSPSLVWISSFCGVTCICCGLALSACSFLRKYKQPVSACRGGLKGSVTKQCLEETNMAGICQINILKCETFNFKVFLHSEIMCLHIAACLLSIVGYWNSPTQQPIQLTRVSIYQEWWVYPSHINVCQQYFWCHVDLGG